VLPGLSTSIPVSKQLLTGLSTSILVSEHVPQACQTPFWFQNASSRPVKPHIDFKMTSAGLSDPILVS
jgi:hypothetical protein